MNRIKHDKLYQVIGIGMVIVALLIFLRTKEVNALPAGSNFVTLQWTSPGDDSLTGTASQYDIRYSTSPITEVTWSTATQCLGEPAPKVAGSAETFTVINLTPNTVYYFAIKTADEVPNWSDLSNVAMIATLDTAKPAKVSDLR